ncbi:hemolysin family protein [Halovivax cerinus]|uniref:Hemolysin family protein n=1 Tax=Halovivax cerinus TaxID=1487865 RepID=A0ABD5NL27_9EURY|nr:hemolysin family protein [Halovivax cerinus]
MVDIAVSLGRFGIALILVALNGFFVAAEFALVRIRPSVVDRLVDEGRTGAGILDEAMENLDNYLAVTQLGITLASLGLGWAGEPAVAALIEPILGELLPAGTVHLVSFAIAFSIITFLHVVFGELAPKTFAIAETERIALFVALPMKMSYYVLYPGIVVFNGAANGFTSLLGVPPASESEETFTEEELLAILSQSGRKGHVDPDEVEMIHRVFDLDDVSVREIMIPAPDVASLDADDDLAAMRRTVVEIGHTRYPVLDEDGDADGIVGFVDAKDIVRIMEPDAATPETTARELARDLPVVPETARVTDVLAQFQTEGRQLAAVVDEWGAFEGIVTVEDVVEVVVGDIRDEFDEHEPSIRERSDGTYVVDGGVTVTALNDRLDTEIAADKVDTVGGTVLERLGQVPDVGDDVTVGDRTLTVDAVDGNRITSVIVSPGETTDSD